MSSRDVPTVGDVFISDVEGDEVPILRVVGLMEAPEGTAVMVQKGRTEHGPVHAVSVDWIWASYSRLIPAEEPEAPFETPLGELAR